MTFHQYRHARYVLFGTGRDFGRTGRQNWDSSRGQFGQEIGNFQEDFVADEKNNDQVCRRGISRMIRQRKGKGSNSTIQDIKEYHMAIKVKRWPYLVDYKGRKLFWNTEC